MVVHGKNPKEVTALARKAWLALVASPFVLAAMITIGQSVFAASGQAEGELLPYGQRVLMTLLLLPVGLAAPVLAARWGHRAHSWGSKSARVPGEGGLLIAVLVGFSLLGGLLQR